MHTAKPKFSLEPHNTLNSPAEQMSIEILWTPGHRRISSNEISDNLAKLREAQLIVGPELAVVKSDTQIKEHFRLWEEENNKESWITAEKTRLLSEKNSPMSDCETAATQ